MRREPDQCCSCLPVKIRDVSFQTKKKSWWRTQTVLRHVAIPNFSCGVQCKSCLYYAVQVRYVVSELITRIGRPFTEWQFLKNCMLQSLISYVLCLLCILCPMYPMYPMSISLSAKTEAMQISELSSNIYEQLLQVSLHTLWCLMKAQTRPTKHC